MADKKLVAATVRSRELGMQRRINQMTTSSHVKTDNVQTEKIEEEDRIHISFKRKDIKRQYITRETKDAKKKKRRMQQQTLVTQCHRGAKKQKQQEKKTSTPWKKRRKEKAAAAKPRLEVEMKRQKGLHSRFCRKT